VFFDLPPVQPTVEVVVASDSIERGVSQSNGDASYGARIQLDSGRYFVGANASTVKLGTGADIEAEAFVGANAEIAGVKLNTSLVYVNYVGTVNGVDQDMVELRNVATRDFGRVGTSFRVDYTPNDYGVGKAATFVEAGASYPVTAGATVSAAVGRNLTSLGDYTTFNVGVTQKLILGTSVDVRYYNNSNERLLGRAGDDRAVVSLTTRF
jgi:uncharacterized protein (TIGR02001 family)